MNLFVNSNDEFSVKIVIGSSKTKPNYIYCDVDEKNLKDAGGDDLADDFKEYTVWFRVPSYSDINRIVDSAIVADTQNIRINAAEMRESRMCTLIKRWNLNGEETAATKEEVLKLHPLVAAVISFGMDIELRERGLI